MRALQAKLPVPIVFLLNCFINKIIFIFPEAGPTANVQRAI